MTVMTGVSGGRNGPRGYYGRRTLCPACAERQRRRNLLFNLSALVVIIGLVIWGIIAATHH